MQPSLNRWLNFYCLLSSFPPLPIRLQGCVQVTPPRGPLQLFAFAEIRLIRLKIKVSEVHRLVWQCNVGNVKILQIEAYLKFNSATGQGWIRKTLKACRYSENRQLSTFRESELAWSYICWNLQFEN